MNKTRAARYGKKNKCLENELVTLRMQNRTDKDNLTSAQQHLYHTQAELDSIKVENMKLNHEIRILTMKPDAPAVTKEKQRIEILPGYNLTPTTVKNLRSEMSNKIARSEEMNPGEHALIDGEFREVKKPTRSKKAILRSLNYTEKDTPNNSPDSSPEIKYLTDNTVESKENDTRPSYVRYRSAVGKNKNNDNCKQQ